MGVRLSDSSDEEGIGDAVENEIGAMESTLSQKDQIKSLLGDNAGPAVILDWSDVENVEKRKGELNTGTLNIGTLKQTSAAERRPGVDNMAAESTLSWNDEDAGWGNDSVWDEGKKPSGIAAERSHSQWTVESKQDSSSPRSEVKLKAKTRSKASDLGAEFDIKSLTIKKPATPSASESMDFFADMEPVIKGNSLLNQTNCVKPEAPSKTSLSYNAVEDGDEVRF